MALASMGDDVQITPMEATPATVLRASLASTVRRRWISAALPLVLMVRGSGEMSGGLAPKACALLLGDTLLCGSPWVCGSPSQFHKDSEGRKTIRRVKG